MAIRADWSNIPLVELQAGESLSFGADRLIKASNAYRRNSFDVGPDARFWNAEGENWITYLCKAYAAAIDAEDEPVQQALARQFVIEVGTLAAANIHRTLSAN